MKKISQRVMAGISLLSLIFAGLLTGLPASAESVSIALSSSASSVQQNNSFVVTASVNTSGQVSDALVRVNFDNTKVSFVSASYSGSPLDQDLGSQAGSNYYTADRYKLGSPFPSGSMTVVELTFKASASSGSTAINVDTGASTIGNAVNGQPHAPLTASGATVSFTAPTSTTATPAQQATTQPSANTAPSQNNQEQAQQNSEAQTGTPTTQEQENNADIDDDQPVPVESFVDRTANYPVEIRITDINGQPVSGLEVTLNDQKVTTNDDGTALFEGISVGEYEVKADGVKGTIIVRAGEPLTAQEFPFIQESSDLLKYVFTVLIAAGLLGVIAFVAIKLKKNRSDSVTYGVTAGGETGLADTQNSVELTEQDKEYLKPIPPEINKVIEPTRENKDIE